MDQSDHAVRNGHGDAGPHQRTVAGRQFDVFGAAQIDARITVVSAAGHREIAVQTNHRKTGGHDATDYPWPRV